MELLEILELEEETAALSQDDIIQLLNKLLEEEPDEYEEEAERR